MDTQGKEEARTARIQVLVAAYVRDMQRNDADPVEELQKYLANQREKTTVAERFKKARFEQA